MRFFIAAVIAVACSAALPRIATTKTPTKTLLRPNLCAVGSIAPTRISLIQAIKAVAAASTSRGAARCPDGRVRFRSVLRQLAFPRTGRHG